MRAARAYGLLAAGAVALAACAPIPVQEAEAQCARLVAPRAPISGEIVASEMPPSASLVSGSVITGR